MKKTLLTLLLINFIETSYSMQSVTTRMHSDSNKWETCTKTCNEEGNNCSELCF